MRMLGVAALARLGKNGRPSEETMPDDAANGGAVPTAAAAVFPLASALGATAFASFMSSSPPLRSQIVASAAPPPGASTAVSMSVSSGTVVPAAAPAGATSGGAAAAKPFPYHITQK